MKTLEEQGMEELFARAALGERAGFRDELRSRLLAEVGPAAQKRRTTPWWTLRVPRPVLAGFAVVAMLFGGSGLAAAGSLPGEPLFELKRAAEEVALALAFDDDTRLARLADQASARLAELQRATDATTRAAAARESARALERLAETQRGSAPAEPGSRASDTVESARDQAESVLRDLEQTLPAEAADGIRRAIEAGRPEQRGPAEDPRRPEATDRPRTDSRPTAAPMRPSPGAPEERPSPPGRSAPDRGPGNR